MYLKDEFYVELVKESLLLEIGLAFLSIVLTPLFCIVYIFYKEELIQFIIKSLKRYPSLGYVFSQSLCFYKKKEVFRINKFFLENNMNVFNLKEQILCRHKSFIISEKYIKHESFSLIIDELNKTSSHFIDLRYKKIEVHAHNAKLNLFYYDRKDNVLLKGWPQAVVCFGKINSTIGVIETNQEQLIDFFDIIVKEKSLVSSL